MLTKSVTEIEQQARRWAAELKTGAVLDGESTVGGGSLPGEVLPTKLLALRLRSPNAFAAQLRQLPRPIIARVAEEKVMLDPRTVLADEETDLLNGLRSLV
jgi:L-seryl-tRNA(Ser) seleniumtransferase